MIFNYTGNDFMVILIFYSDILWFSNIHLQKFSYHSYYSVKYDSLFCIPAYVHTKTHSKGQLNGLLFALDKLAHCPPKWESLKTKQTTLINCVYLWPYMPLKNTEDDYSKQIQKSLIERHNTTLQVQIIKHI